MRVSLHPDARGELRDARRWYYERSLLSATAFAHAIEKAISRIREEPNSFPLAAHGTRKLTLLRFPFNVFYRSSEIDVVIIAVAHQKRRPGYWSERL